MIVGLLSRFSALSNIVIMVGAIAMVHAANGFFMANGGFEYNAPDEIHHEVRSRAADARPAALPDWAARPRPLQLSGTLRVGVPAMFNGDGLSRRAGNRP